MHYAGWVHCDVSPANILLDAQHRARLVDMEYAKKMGSENQEGYVVRRRLVSGPCDNQRLTCCLRGLLSSWRSRWKTNITRFKRLRDICPPLHQVFYRPHIRNVTSLQVRMTAQHLSLQGGCRMSALSTLPFDTTRFMTWSHCGGSACTSWSTGTPLQTNVTQVLKNSDVEGTRNAMRRGCSLTAASSSCGPTYSVTTWSTSIPLRVLSATCSTHSGTS